MTGWSIDADQVGHELGVGAHERGVVVGARVVGPQDEPLEMVDMRVEAMRAGPGQDPPRDLGRQRRVHGAACRAAASRVRGIARISPPW